MDGVMEIEAFFDDLAELQVGERTTLRIALRNGSADMTQAGRLLVRATGVSLVSTSPYEIREPSRGAADELVLIVPKLVRDERIEYCVEVYARAPGELGGIVRFECGTQLREATFAHACRARAAFGTDANRFEMFDSEADAGALVEGRVIVTNTGSAPAAIDELRVLGELEDLVIENHPHALEPQERAIVRVRGRVPAALADRTLLLVRASLLAEGTVHEIGSAQIVARSRALLVGTIEPRSDAALGWRITISNAGGATAHARIAFNSPSAQRIAPGESVTLECIVDLENANLADAAGARSATLDPATIRYIRTLGGLMRHLWTLPVLYDENVAHAGIRTALRSVFDRLSIKLRMPHYPVTADDVLDPAALDALAAHFEGSAPTLGARLAAACELIVDRAAAYRSILAATLSAYDDAAFIDALVVPHPSLDDALERMLAGEESAVAA